MKEKNTLEYGEVQEEITMTVEYGIYKQEKSLRTEGKMTKTASLRWGRFSFGDGMSMRAIVDFQEQANALLQSVKDLLMDGTFVKVNITKSAYEHIPEYTMFDELGLHKCTIKQLEFESWIFEGSGLDEDPEEEGAGLYLQPETRYTKEHWGMMLPWKQDILQSLAEANL